MYLQKYKTVLREGLCEVVLKNVPLESTGRYRVEVNTALPFASQMTTEEVMVVVSKYRVVQRKYIRIFENADVLQFLNILMIEEQHSIKAKIF